MSKLQIDMKLTPTKISWVICKMVTVSKAYITNIINDNFGAMTFY